jgi:hypothetical protein
MGQNTPKTLGNPFDRLLDRGLRLLLLSRSPFAFPGSLHHSISSISE